jgi:hypothetical protein
MTDTFWGTFTLAMIVYNLIVYPLNYNDNLYVYVSWINSLYGLTLYSALFAIWLAYFITPRKSFMDIGQYWTVKVSIWALIPIAIFDIAQLVGLCGVNNYSGLYINLSQIFGYVF